MCSRVLGRVIAKRVERWVKHLKLLDENQAVFRERRSTADVVQVMTRIQVNVVGCKCRVNEDANVMDKDEWPCAKLLDLKKAYPRVSKSAFWSLLERYGMKGQCLEMLMDLHDTTEYRVKCREGISEGWMPARVLHEECTTSPILFNIYHHAVMRKALEARAAEGREKSVEWQMVTHLPFTELNDDIFV